MANGKQLFKTLFRTKKRAVITLVVFAILGFWAFGMLFPKPATQQIQTTQVVRGNIIATLSESGNISAGTQASVTSPTDGIIQEVYVKNGDSVDVGQSLFTVKSTATPAQQAAAYASFLSAQNNLNAAKSKMNSLQSALFKANQAFVTDKGIGNPSDAQKADPKYIEENADWLQAESDYNNQAGVISQTQAAYTSAALSYQATQNAVVTAPIAGTVANFSASIGSSVSSGGNTNTNSATTANSSSSSSGGSAVLVIGNFSNLLVKVAVSEVDIPKIKVGQKATITLDAFPDQTFVGTVTSIDTLGTVSSGVVTFDVYITLVSPPASIRSGMSASAAIQTNRKDNVLMVPTSAVQTTNGQSVVRVQKNGQITQVPVEVGISSDSETEIISGLSEGDTVVTSTVSTGTGAAGAVGTSPFGGFGGGRGAGGGGAVFFRGGGAGGGRGG